MTTYNFSLIYFESFIRFIRIFQKKAKERNDKNRSKYYYTHIKVVSSTFLV